MILELDELGRFSLSLLFGLGVALQDLPEVNASDAGARSDSTPVVEPRRYRGPYVPPAGHEGGADPFAPGPDSPYWMRLEMADPEGRKTFDPHLVEVASRVRYEQRNPALGLDLRIDLDMHPQPFMTVNEKIYPVQFDLRGWWLVADVSADVGTRQFENAWFTAFGGQSVIVSGLPATAAVPGFLGKFGVDEASFSRVQKTVVHDDGRTTSRIGYVGSLSLRESFGSFVSRQFGLALQQSFVLAYGAFIGVAFTLIVGCLVTFTGRWLRSRRGHRTVSVRQVSESTSGARRRQDRKRRRKRR